MGGSIVEKFFPGDSPSLLVPQNNSPVINTPIGLQLGSLGRELMNHGVKRNRVASSVELDGNVCLLTPESDISYLAHRATVYWETPITVDILGIESNDSGQTRDFDEFQVGRLDFRSVRNTPKIGARPVISAEDPNITLYTPQGIIQLNQISGIPRFYVINCKVRYLY